MSREAELAKLEYNLGGVRNMQRLPQAAVIIDLKTEVIAVREAERLRIPIIGLVDSNVDPVPVEYPVPGNDDSIRSCELVVRTIGDRERILIFGPSSTRLALEREYVAMYRRPDRLVDVEPGDALDRAELVRRLCELAA